MTGRTTVESRAVYGMVPDAKAASLASESSESSDLSSSEPSDSFASESSESFALEPSEFFTYGAHQVHWAHCGIGGIGRIGILVLIESMRGKQILATHGHHAAATLCHCLGAIGKLACGFQVLAELQIRKEHGVRFHVT